MVDLWASHRQVSRIILRRTLPEVEFERLFTHRVIAQLTLDITAVGTKYLVTLLCCSGFHQRFRILGPCVATSVCTAQHGKVFIQGPQHHFSLARRTFGEARYTFETGTSLRAQYAGSFDQSVVQTLQIELQSF